MLLKSKISNKISNPLSLSNPSSHFPPLPTKQPPPLVPPCGHEIGDDSAIENAFGSKKERLVLKIFQSCSFSKLFFWKTLFLFFSRLLKKIKYCVIIVNFRYLMIT